MKRIKKLCFFMMVMVFALAMAVSSSAAAKKVKLNKDTLALEVGQKFTLQLKNTKEKVTWESKNPAVVTVTKKGVVKAVKRGKAVVTAKAGKKTYKCKVTVNPKTLFFENPTVKLYAGETKDYTILKAPKLAVKCTSSNPGVAQLDPTDYAKGMIVTKGVGECVLTVTYSDGSNAQCKVIVEKLTPTGIHFLDAEKQIIPEEGIRLHVGEKTKIEVELEWPVPQSVVDQLPETCKEEGWTFAKGSIGQNCIKLYTNGVISAVQPGTASVYATLTNGTRAKLVVIIEE